MNDGSTQNFYSNKLHQMEEHPADSAMVIGRKEPYYLQYLKEGKPNVKPKNNVRNTKADR